VPGLTCTRQHFRPITGGIDNRHEHALFDYKMWMGPCALNQVSCIFIVRLNKRFIAGIVEPTALFHGAYSTVLYVSVGPYLCLPYLSVRRNEYKCGENHLKVR